VELVTDYLDGALSAADHADVENHLRGCGNCLRYLGQIQATLRALAALPVGELETGCVSLSRRRRGSRGMP
jgi:anti-sigma factor RsiW